MKIIFFIFALVLISMSAFAQTQQTKSESQIKTVDLQPPLGWRKTGSHRPDYDFQLDSIVKRSGKASGILRSRSTATNESHAAMVQGVKPGNYRGKRIRISGYLKTENVSNYSGFWLRIDDADDEFFPLAFDGMKDRIIKGTNDWKKYEVILDVPDRAGLIFFGVNLVGSGQVWADDLQLEIVGNDIASTGLPTTPEMATILKEDKETMRKDPKAYDQYRQNYSKLRNESPMQPVNLDFENGKQASDKKNE
ncbi:MAG: hypothetical protein H7070_00600 [Saprospiraceae bacterium]|nr:hypothetical protein [Pyrinomonadaceae bacterium]